MSWLGTAAGWGSGRGRVTSVSVGVELVSCTILGGAELLESVLNIPREALVGYTREFRFLCVHAGVRHCSAELQVLADSQTTARTAERGSFRVQV